MWSSIFNLNETYQFFSILLAEYLLQAENSADNCFNFRCCMFHGLGPLTCSYSELTSETVNAFRHFGRTPWTGDRPIARPIPTQDSTTQKYADIHPCLERVSNRRSHCLSGINTIGDFRPCDQRDRRLSKAHRNIPVNLGVGYFPLSSASRPTLGPKKPPIQWIPEALTPRTKRPGREADHSPPSRVKVKNAWSYTSTPPVGPHGVVLN